MKNKKRLGFMILVIVMLMSIASVASASYNYSGSFSTAVMTNGSVSVVTYIRDSNTYCWYVSSYLTTGYTSQAYLYDSIDKRYEYEEQAYNTSGNTLTHYLGYQPDGMTGKLRFVNTQVPGYTCVIKGVMS